MPATRHQRRQRMNNMLFNYILPMIVAGGIVYLVISCIRKLADLD